MLTAEVTSTRSQGRRPLTTSVLSLGIGAVLARLSGLFVLAAVYRSGGAAAAGWYGVGSLAGALVAFAVGLGLTTYATREFAAGRMDARDVDRLHRLRLVLAVPALAALAALAPALPSSVGLGWWLIAAAAVLEQQNEIAWAVVRGGPRAAREAVTNGWVSLAVSAGAGASLLVGDGLALEGAGTLLLVAAVLKGIASRRCLRAATDSRRSTGTSLVHHVRRALPYSASELLGLAYLRGDTLVLATLLPAAAVGVYVSATAFVTPLVQVAAAMSAGAVALLARMSGRAVAEDRDLTAWFFAASGSAAAACVCLGAAPVAAALFEDTGQIAIVTVVLALFLPLRFVNFALSARLLAEGRPGRRLLLVAAALVANVGLCIPLTQAHGVHGAAVATVLTELLLLALLLASTAWADVRPCAALLSGCLWASAALVLSSALDVSDRGALVALALVAGTSLASALLRSPVLTRKVDRT